MSQPLSIETTLALPNSSVRIPQLGFGVYQSSREQCKASCLAALKSGYRHIDTAQFYANEQQVGEAVRDSGIPREDIFVTTKILAAGATPEKTYEKCLHSVDLLDSRENGYVDLFLIHSPHSGQAKVKEMWQALEKLVDEGKVKAIGVSNFSGEHITTMKTFASIWPPHINQIELHPWCQQRDVVKYCQKNNIVVEAYCPLARMIWKHNETLNSIADSHNKNIAQVMVRYCLQKGWVPLPKSDSEDRIKGNADLYDFELKEDDMKALDDLEESDKSARAVVEKVEGGFK